MAITETVTLDQAGLPVIELSIPVGLPQKPAPSQLLPLPNTGSADPVTATAGGTLLDDINYFYVFTSVDGSGNESVIGIPVPVLTGNSGGDTNKNTITDVDFPDEATQYKVYRSDGDSHFFKRIQDTTAIPDPFTFTDTGLSQSNILAPDGSFFAARIVWRKQSEKGWRFGAQDTVSPLKFAVPANIASQVIDLKLMGVGLDGSKTPDTKNPTTTHTVVGTSSFRLGGPSGLLEGRVRDVVFDASGAGKLKPVKFNLANVGERLAVTIATGAAGGSTTGWRKVDTLDYDVGEGVSSITFEMTLTQGGAPAGSIQIDGAGDNIGLTIAASPGASPSVSRAASGTLVYNSPPVGNMKLALYVKVAVGTEIFVTGVADQGRTQPVGLGDLT